MMVARYVSEVAGQGLDEGLDPAPGHSRALAYIPLQLRACALLLPLLPSWRTGNADVFKRPDPPKAPHLTLASLANNLHADPRMLGERRPIPLSVYHCLAELGITSLQTLVCKNRTSQVVLIDTTELKRRYGSAVQTRHLKALNKFTILANQGASGCTSSLATVGCAPIASSQRVVHKELLEAEFKEHARPTLGHVEGSWTPDSRRGKTQLTEQAFARVLQAATHPDDFVDQPLDITIQPKGKRTCKRKADPAYAVRMSLKLYRQRLCNLSDDPREAGQTSSGQSDLPRWSLLLRFWARP